MIISARRNGDCRIPAAQSPDAQVKVLSIKEWNDLYQATSNFLYSYSRELAELDDSLPHNLRTKYQTWLMEWRKHMPLQRELEEWLEGKRDARANS